MYTSFSYIIIDCRHLEKLSLSKHLSRKKKIGVETIIPPGKQMAQLPCIGLSCPLLNHIWGSCAIYFHHRGVVFNTYIGFEAGRLQMDIWMDFWMIPDGLPVVRGFNLQYQKLILPSRHYSGISGKTMGQLLSFHHGSFVFASHFLTTKKHPKLKLCT